MKKIIRIRELKFKVLNKPNLLEVQRYEQGAGWLKIHARELYPILPITN